jgi:hypothetical protein
VKEPTATAWGSLSYGNIPAVRRQHLDVAGTGEIIWLLDELGTHGADGLCGLLQRIWGVGVILCSHILYSVIISLEMTDVLLFFR